MATCGHCGKRLSVEEIRSHYGRRAAGATTVPGASSPVAPAPGDRPRTGVEPGPGPTGYYGGLGRSARRAPVYDPHPERSCPSCGRPELGCTCS